MNPQNWQKFEEIFQAALDLSGAERAAFLDRECAGDGELRREIENLIAGYEADEGFLESPVWTDSRFLHSEVKKDIASSLEDEAGIDNNAPVFIDRQVGAYRLVKELGRGGMGEVFLAERADGEFRQNVAVKLIKRGMDTDFIVKRFRHERQIVATLNHPNIARLLDGGTTGDGLPFFVMEYVEGEPFFKYAESHNLNLHEKLELFLQVCAAISYAHRRKIIHRDIKPSNILVTEDNEPKLLDFGIAKLLDPDLIHESMIPQTGTQMRLMTPEYASPEQVRGDEITGASDQYSLGVLLYELITGARPYKFSSRAPHEIARVICEEIPDGPSSEIPGKTLPADLAFDQASGEKLDRIVLKSLEKDPLERYSSVKDFAADIRHFLRGEQISAGSPAENDPDPSKTPAKISGSFELKANQKSIAVLPLKNLNAAPGEQQEQAEGSDYLNIGLADALITRLSNVREFIVRPTSSVLRYAASDTDSFTAGKELKVAFVLDGNILRIDKRIRISIQLLDIAAESTVWADRFDEDLTDVLTLEDLISSRVAESLVPQLSTGDAKNLAHRSTDNVTAYDAFMRGRVFWNTFTMDGMRRAVEFYEEAIRLDPGYAQAYAAIADYYVWLGMSCFMPTGEFYPLAKKAVDRAIELDPQSSEAYAARGLLEIYGSYDWTESEKNMRRAVELNPNNAVAHNWFFHPLFTRGEFAAGEKHLLRALELDPTSFQNNNSYAWSLYFERRLDEAIVKADELIENFPQTAYSYFAKSSFLRVQGKTKEALRLARRAAELSGDGLFTYFGLGAALAADGRREEAKKIIANPPAGFSSNYHAAEICCALKDKEEAFLFLEKAFAAREVPLIWLGIEPSLDFIRDDPRYLALLEKMKHPLPAKTENSATPVEAQNKITAAARSPQPTASEAETIIQTTEKPAGALPARAAGKLSAPLKYALAAAAVIISGFFIYYAGSHLKFDSSIVVSPGDARGSWRSIFASTMSIRRLTTTGKETLAAISSDGSGFAYVSAENEKQSLWLRSTEGGEARRLVAAAPVLYVGLAFAPDGKSLFYTTIDIDFKQRELYQVALDKEEPPQKIAENITSQIGFSPDGRYFAHYGLSRQQPSASALHVRQIGEDGTPISDNEVVVLAHPEIFLANPAFSADGKKIAYAANLFVNEKHTVGVFVYDTETKSEKRLETGEFFDVASIVCRSNQNELVIAASGTSGAPYQLWLVNYETGETQKLTNDLNNYSSVSLDKNSSSLVAVRSETNADVWLTELNQPNNAAGLKRLTSGVNSQAGIKGLGWTPDGKIYYVDADEGKNVVRTINADGSSSETINIKNMSPGSPIFSTDNRFLFFINDDIESEVWRYELNGEKLTRITDKFTYTPALTPDNRFIIYSAENDRHQVLLHRVSSEGEGGGVSEKIAAPFSLRPVISPDNRFLAYYLRNEQTAGEWSIAVAPLSDPGSIRIIRLLDTVNLLSPLERPLAWSSDSRSLLYLNDKGGVSNIFSIAADGTGKTEQLTYFPADRIFNFAMSPDNRRAAVTRGSISSDIVIFKHSR